MSADQFLFHFLGLACHDIFGNGILVQRNFDQFHGRPEFDVLRVRPLQLDG